MRYRAKEKEYRGRKRSRKEKRKIENTIMRNNYVILVQKEYEERHLL